MSKIAILTVQWRCIMRWRWKQSSMSALPHYRHGSRASRREIAIGLSWWLKPAWLGYIFNVGVGKTVGRIFHAPLSENPGTLCFNCTSSVAMIVVLVRGNHLCQWRLCWSKGIEVWGSLIGQKWGGFREWIEIGRRIWSQVRLPKNADVTLKVLRTMMRSRTQGRERSQVNVQ